MTVEYKDGNRITALSTDILPTNPQDGMVVEFTDTGAIGFRHNNQWQIPSAWEFLGSTKNNSANDAFSVTLPDDKIRDTYTVLSHVLPITNNVQNDLIFNDVTGTSYSRTYSSAGGADTTAVSQADTDGGNTLSDWFTVYEISNIINQEKLGTGHQVTNNSSGAGVAPNRIEHGFKYQGSELIKKIGHDGTGNLGDYDTNTEMIVLGQSANLTVPENRRFWKQIAFSEVRGELPTNTPFVASWEGDYDYLWIILYGVNVDTNFAHQIRLNGSEANDYARRTQINGGTDNPVTSASKMDLNIASINAPQFSSTILVNKPTEEKLGLSEVMTPNAVGSDTAPTRGEHAWKFVNTTNRVKQVSMWDDTSNGMGTGSFILVYGGNALW